VVGEPEGLAAAIAGTIAAQPPADEHPGHKRVDQPGKIMHRDGKSAGNGTGVVLVNQRESLAHGLAIQIGSTTNEFTDGF